MPDLRGEEVRQHGGHGDERIVGVDKAEQPAPRERHAGRRQVVELLLRFVGARAFAVDGEKVLRVALEEALHLGDVGRAQLAHPHRGYLPERQRGGSPVIQQTSVSSTERPSTQAANSAGAARGGKANAVAISSAK